MRVFDSPSIDREIARARQLIVNLCGQDGLVRFTSFRDLDDYIVGRNGFSRVKVEELKGTLNIQVFYRYTNVWVRLKDQPRWGRKSAGHMAVILGADDTWDGEVAKFSRTGQIIPKQGFIRRLNDESDWRNLSRAGDSIREIYQTEDAWANSCHFDLVENFDWRGVEAYI